jgi:hypothetical protein
MDKQIVILGVKKACIVLHGLAFSFKDDGTRKETLALVDALSEAIKLLEAE